MCVCVYTYNKQRVTNCLTFNATLRFMRLSDIC